MNCVSLFDFLSLQVSFFDIFNNTFPDSTDGSDSIELFDNVSSVVMQDDVRANFLLITRFLLDLNEFIVVHLLDQLANLIVGHVRLPD